MKKHDTDIAEKGYDVMGKCARPSKMPHNNHASVLFSRLCDVDLWLSFVLQPSDIMPFQEEP